MTFLKSGFTLFGGLVWGAFFSVFPVDMVFVSAIIWAPLLLAFELWGYSRRKSFRPVVLKSAVALVVVLGCFFAPTKYKNTAVDLNGVGTVAIGDLGLIRDSELSYMYFPTDMEAFTVTLPSKIMQLKDVIALIEAQTGLKHRLGYCGTGCNILFGCGPMGGIFFTARVVGANSVR